MPRKTLPTEPEPAIETRFVGYARVSTEDQNLNLQLDALRKVGVQDDNLHWEKLSAVSKKRPALDHAIMDLHEGDTFVVWKLDRLARNMEDLLNRLKQIREAGAEFMSLTEAIDTNTPAGKFLMYVMGAVAQFERDLTAARTSAGMQAAAKRGLRLGAERKMTPAVLAKALRMLKRGHSVVWVAKALKVSKPSIYNYFQIKRREGRLPVVTQRKK